jgi:hypothetical protein
MLVPHQEVAAANAEGVRPMEGTAIVLLPRLLLFFTLIYGVVRQRAVSVREIV